MKLSIIIVHHKTPELLRLCITSIRRNITDIDHEIIVVDSESSRISQDIVYDEFPGVRFIPYRENIGYARGVNAGIKKAKGEYFFILNPDIIIADNSVPKMLDYMGRFPRVGLLGPQLLDFNGRIQKSYFRFYTPTTILARRTLLGKFRVFKKSLHKFLMLDTDPGKIQEPDWIMGSALMTYRDAIEKVGLMDERFFLYFEDVDWARRFWENGYSVAYFPKAKMYHYHQRKSKAGFGIFDFFIRKETRWHLKSALQYFIKYGFSTKYRKQAQTIHQ